MNNSNDSPAGQEPGAGDGNKWNYIPLVHMLGMFLYGWIWRKESQREIRDCKQALFVQSIRLIKERKQFQQREALETWHQQATNTLKELEGQLVERQYIYCSRIQYRDQRLEMEKNMLLKVVKDPIGAKLGLESGLNDIFKRDKCCANILNTDKRKNGSLMWVYLKYWQDQVTVQKQTAKEAILGGDEKSQ